MNTQTKPQTQPRRHQFFLSDIERDLLITSLENLSAQISPPQTAFEQASRPMQRAGSFTVRRIKEMESRLREPDAKKATAP